MRRRGLIVAATAASASRAAAQGAPAVPRVGWLRLQGPDYAPGQLRAFTDAMAALGHVEGRSYVLEPRYGDGAAASQPPLAADLVMSGVAVIVATSQPSTEAAWRTTRSVPIVGRMTDDPVQAGLALGLARPGGNVTGVYTLLEEMSPKRLALLREAVPSLRRVGALLQIGRGATARWLAATRDAAAQMGVELRTFEMTGADGLDALFAELSAQRIDGLVGFRNPVLVTHDRRIAALAERHDLPAIFDAREFVEAGALMSYGPNLEALFRRAASHVDRLLRGASPSELPIEQPTTFELVVNMRTARAIGLALAPGLLARADEVIE